MIVICHNKSNVIKRIFFNFKDEFVMKNNYSLDNSRQFPATCFAQSEI